jgi:pyrroline-5-carboxylate reductase
MRVEPNTACAVRRGVLVVPEESEVLDELGQLGAVVRVPEAQMSVAGAISGVGPAYMALVAEAWTDAAVRHGMRPAVATRLVGATFGGAAALLEHEDTLQMRRAVTSPGGSTARGLDALERAGLRGAFAAAMDDVIA